jgi:hypothetical protein
MGQRRLIAMYDKSVWSHSGRFPKVLQKILTDLNVNPSELGLRLTDSFTDSRADGRMLRPEDLALIIDLDASWWRCTACTVISRSAIANQCPECGSSHGAYFNPNHDTYTKSRKGFWRDRLRAVAQGGSPAVHDPNRGAHRSANT